MQKSGVPAEVVRNAGDLAEDPHLLARAFFRKISHPAVGEIPTDTLPIRFEGQGQDPWEPSPLLGEDNHYVYGELLGLSEAEIKTYMEKGVIA